MACTCEDALAALSAHIGLPLAFHDDACEFLVGGQPFTVRREEDPARLVLAALVADDLPDAPSRKLVCDLLDFGFGMLLHGLPAVARDPETGLLSAFALFQCATLTAAELPEAFDRFASFASALSDRLAAERAGGVEDAPEPAGEPPGDSLDIIHV